MVRLSSVIPNFTADTTKGRINFYDYAGDSWVLLFSHPSDFTPVCTTELGRMAVHIDEFKKRNVKLLGLSCDPVESHQGWLNDIKSYCLDIKGDFPYPIIADANKEIAIKLDMFDEDARDNPELALAIRALYIIDPNKKLRLAMVYPTTTGRNIDEVLRAIDSLQLVDKYDKVVATPANWKPGEKLMIAPSASEENVKKFFRDSDIDVVNVPSDKCYLRTTLKYKY